MKTAPINPSASILLVIDMQNAFVLPSSPLCVAMAGQTVSTLQQTIEKARKSGIQILWVCRRHAADGSDLEVFSKRASEENESAGSLQ